MAGRLRVRSVVRELREIPLREPLAVCKERLPTGTEQLLPVQTCEGRNDGNYLWVRKGVKEMIKDLGNGIKLECPDDAAVVLACVTGKGMQIGITGKHMDVFTMLTLLLDQALKDVPEEILRAGMLHSMMACIRDHGTLGENVKITVDYTGKSVLLGDIINRLINELHKKDR